jgi:hypothetical protein
MVMSNTCMNVANEMPIVANARFGGRNPVMLAAVGAGPALAVVADMDMGFFARHSREGGNPVALVFGSRFGFFCPSFLRRQESSAFRTVE